MIDDELAALQQKVVKKVNDNDEFNNLVERIQELRERQSELNQQQTLNTGNMDRINKIREEMKSGKKMFWHMMISWCGISLIRSRCSRTN